MFKGAVVVMGVAGCGKTSVGQSLAKHIGASFVEGDTLHPKSNTDKMSAGHPLTDEDRWPWLEQIGESLSGDSTIVASCSALKRSYREKISETAGRPVAFVFLDGSRALLEARMNMRKGHFMPPALLASQLQTLERPAADENVISLSIADPVDELVEKAAKWLLSKMGQSWQNV